LARDLGVKILVDAEFYSCKLAISTIALSLMARYNSRDYVVGDTIQGYLKVETILFASITFRCERKKSSSSVKNKLGRA